jgi:hypothetical protein
MVWPWHGGRLLTAHCRDSGEQLQAGAHARVRELATMTAAEPERGLFFWHNAAQVASHWGIRASTAQREKGRPMKSPHAGALIRRQTKSNPSLFCVASLT